MDALNRDKVAAHPPGRYLWARSYFAVTISNMSDEIIKKFIEFLGEEPSDDGNFEIGD